MPDKIKTISEYLLWVERLEGARIIYRGLADVIWTASSSADRRISDKNQQNKSTSSAISGVLEYTEGLLAGAKRDDFHIDKNQQLSDLKILAKLQHDEAATCFTDFTYDPLVALWFACDPSIKKDGKVISINAGNIDNFSEIPDGEPEYEMVKNFLGKREKPWKWQPPMHLNMRVPVQKSIFVFGLVDITNLGYEVIKVDKNAKEAIRLALSRRYGVNEEGLFPDYAGFAKLNASNRQLSADYYSRMGAVAYQKGDYQKAIQNYKKAIDLVKAKDAPHYNLGLAYEGLNQYNKAIESYTKSLKIDGENASAYNSRGNSYASMGYYGEAIKDYTKAIKTDGSKAVTYINRAKSHLGNCDYRKAIKDLGKAIKLNRGDADAYYWRGLVRSRIAYSGKSNYDDAINDLGEAIRLDENYDAAYYQRGQFYACMGHYGKAIKDLNRAIELNDSNAEFYCWRGIAYIGKGAYNDAIKDLGIAIQLDLNHAAAYYNRGLAYFQKGNYDRAIEDLDEGLRLGFSKVAIYPARGKVRQKIGDEEGAQEDFAKAAKLLEKSQGK